MHLFESLFIFLFLNNAMVKNRFTVKCIMFFEKLQIRTNMYFTFLSYIVLCNIVLLNAFNIWDNYFCNIEL